MRKKLSLFIFTIFISVIFSQSVSAITQLTCTYSNLSLDGYKILFNLVGNSAEITEITKIEAISGGTTTDVTKKIKVQNIAIEEGDDCPGSIYADEDYIDLKVSVLHNQTKIYKLVTSSSEFISSSSCKDYTKEDSCRNSGNSGKVACVWNETNINGTDYEFCNTDNLLYVSCGDARDIPIQVPKLISFFVNFLKIVTPIILIFMGIITLVKAIAASKEDEIKKAQGSLVKKLIAAAMVFFVVTIVQFVISLVADAEYESEINNQTEQKNLSDCLECFLDGNCDRTAYYKTNIAGQEFCTELGSNSNNFDLCPEEKVQ